MPLGLSGGNHSTTAAYTGGTSYNTSTSSPLTQTVNKATPTVTTWPAATDITSGQTLASSTLNGGSASVEDSFAFETPTYSPSAGTYSAAVVFTPTNTVNYDSVSGSVNVQVASLAAQNGSWSTPATWGGSVPAAGGNGRSARASP